MNSVFRAILLSAIIAIAIGLVLYLFACALTEETKQVKTKSNFQLIREVRVGMSSDSLLRLLGEPSEIKIQEDGEDWRYEYRQRNQTNSTLQIKIEVDTINGFYSY